MVALVLFVCVELGATCSFGGASFGGGVVCRGSNGVGGGIFVVHHVLVFVRLELGLVFGCLLMKAFSAMYSGWLLV